MRNKQNNDAGELMSLHDSLKEAARKLGLLETEEDLELYLASPGQLITPLVFSGTFERYAHWSFGKKAEQHRQALGVYSAYSYPDIFLPSRPNRAFIGKGTVKSFQVAALARFIAYADFCDRNTNWWKVDYTNVWREVQEHARFVYDLLKDSAIDSYRVSKTLTAAHAIAPQSGHRTALSGESSDLIKEIAEKSHILDDWQRELLLMVRKEWLWFLPYVETGMMMRGWAAFWQLRLLREVKLPAQLYLRCMADLANVLALPRLGQVNHTLLMYKIFENLYNSHSDRFIREIVANENDASFVAKYLTQEVAVECGLFSWGHDDENKKKIVVKELSTDSGWEKVRELLVKNLSSNAFPAFRFFDTRTSPAYTEKKVAIRGFFLVHQFEGRFLDRDQSNGTCEHILWLSEEPVYLYTLEADRSSGLLRHLSFRYGYEYEEKYKQASD